MDIEYIAFFHQSDIGEVKKQFYIYPHENLYVVSKVLCVKYYEVNWNSKLILPFKALECNYIIQFHHVQTMHHFKIYARPSGMSRMRAVIHIVSISPSINNIIENSYI